MLSEIANWETDAQSYYLLPSRAAKDKERSYVNLSYNKASRSISFIFLVLWHLTPLFFETQGPRKTFYLKTLLHHHLPSSQHHLLSKPLPTFLLWPRWVALIGHSAWTLLLTVLPLSSNVTSPERRLQTTLYKTGPLSQTCPTWFYFYSSWHTKYSKFIWYLSPATSGKNPDFVFFLSGRFPRA